MVKKSYNNNYKTVRIHTEEFKEFRRLAFYEDVTLIEVISKALLCYKHYNAANTFEDHTKQRQEINSENLNQHKIHGTHLMEDIDTSKREKLLWIMDRFLDLAQPEIDDDLKLTRSQFQRIFGIKKEEYYGIIYAILLHSGSGSYNQ